jgi:hypothetical protein
MEITDPGHSYRLRLYWPDGGTSYTTLPIHFIKKEGEKFPGNVGSYSGTLTQEVLRALIDRLLYVNNQKHSRYTSLAIAALRMAFYELEQRVRDERDQPVLDVDIDFIEHYAACNVCGHIICLTDHI